MPFLPFYPLFLTDLQANETPERKVKSEIEFSMDFNAIHRRDEMIHTNMPLCDCTQLDGGWNPANTVCIDSPREKLALANLRRLKIFICACTAF